MTRTKKITCTRIFYIYKNLTNKSTMSRIATTPNKAFTRMLMAKTMAPKCSGPGRMPGFIPNDWRTTSPFFHLFGRRTPKRYEHRAVDPQRHRMRSTAADPMERTARSTRACGEKHTSVASVTNYMKNWGKCQVRWISVGVWTWPPPGG